MLPKEDLLRFVVGPDDTLFADVDGTLPGRGIWVRLEKEAVEQAIKKHLFDKHAKKKLKVPATLPEDILRQLHKKALGYLSLCRKAGHAVSGVDKVRERMTEGKVSALLLASDSTFEGRDDIRKHAKNVEMVTQFTASELQSALSSDKAVHALLEGKELAVACLVTIHRIERFNGNK